MCQSIRGSFRNVSSVWNGLVVFFSLLLGLQRSTEYRTELLKVDCLYFYRLSKNFTIIPVSVIGFICLNTEQNLKLFSFHMYIASPFLSMVKFCTSVVTFISWNNPCSYMASSWTVWGWRYVYWSIELLKYDDLEQRGLSSVFIFFLSLSPTHSLSLSLSLPQSLTLSPYTLPPGVCLPPLISLSFHLSIHPSNTLPMSHSPALPPQCISLPLSPHPSLSASIFLSLYQLTSQRESPETI